GLTVVDGSLFNPNDLVLVTDFVTGHLVRIQRTTLNADSTWTLQVAAPSSLCGSYTGNIFPDYQPTSVVLGVRMVNFFVESDAAVGNFPTLMMDPDGDGPLPPQPSAPGVEDMQVAIGVDLDSNSVLTDNGSMTDDWIYNNVSDSPPPDISYPWRALRI